MSTDLQNEGGNGSGGMPPARAAGGQLPYYATGSEAGTLRGYLTLLWRRKWVILLLVVVATGGAFFYAYRQPKVYEASTKLIYEQQVSVSNPLTGASYTDANERYSQLSSVGEVLASPDMQQRAAEMLKAEGVTGTAFEVTAKPLTPDSSNSSMYAATVVQITATSNDPKVAAAAANAYAVTYVAYRKELIRAQIQRVLLAVRAKLDTFTGAARQSADYLVLEQRLQDLQLLRNTATGNFRVLVPATVPTAPVSPRPLYNAGLGFVVGLIAGIALALLLEQFDTRLRRADEVAAIVRLPILGRIPRISHRLLGQSAVVALQHPHGQLAEAFRKVRTNLDFLAVDKPIKSMLVTSCVQGEGKSVAVANLAATLAIAGKKVVVIDADLRRPRQHEYFAVSNDRGLSTVATGQDKLFDALISIDVAPQHDGAGAGDFHAWAEAADARARMYVLPAGPMPPNPGEIVASQRLAGIIDQLTFEADVVIVDTPAMLPVGDAAAIAPKVDGLVFLVDMHVITRPQLEGAADQLAKLPVRMLGLVLRETRGGGRYYSSYGHYGYGYTTRDDGRGAGGKGAKSESGPAKARV